MTEASIASVWVHLVSLHSEFYNEDYRVPRIAAELNMLSDATAMTRSRSRVRESEGNADYMKSA
jgi:hypothetical protein